jgi:hypothetical protein
MSVDFAVSHVLQSGLEPELMDYFGVWGVDGREALYHLLRDFISDKFRLLQLNGVAA